MNETLQILSKEDPTFTFHEDQETGQLIISGMGELHLDVLVTRMKDDFNVKCRVGAPQVTYREAVTQNATVTEEFSKVLAGKENNATVTLSVSATEQGAGNSYKLSFNKKDIPEEIIESIEQSLKSSLDSGIQYGYPCTDTFVEVTDIKYDEATSTTFAFASCTAMAFDSAANKASPAIFEPVMNVEISCPKEFVGEAMSQVTQRGGMVMGQDSKPTIDIVHAQSPMAKMFGFSTNLRSATQGRASFTMEFSHFQLKPDGLNTQW